MVTSRKLYINNNLNGTEIPKINHAAVKLKGLW
jgi:hypothetical protein